MATVAWHGKRAVLENQNYQLDRQFKQNYILVNVIAEGYDQKRFVEFMVKKKSKCKIFIELTFIFFIDTTPNVDYFTKDEVKKMVLEFKEKCETGELDRVRRINFASLICSIPFLDGSQQLYDE